MNISQVMRLGLVLLSVLVATTVSATGLSAPVVPLARAHAHNDYEHQRPLLDALDRGFTSVEADVWLVGGDLLVGHDLSATRAGRTLKSLYLEPLLRRVEGHGGRVYAGYAGPFILLVDVKSDGTSTYRVLHEQLRAYQTMVTVFTRQTTRAGVVTVIVSGNRAREAMLGQDVRYAAYDGRLSDLGAPDSSREFMPLVSDNWSLQFGWMGLGPMPADERGKLRTIVARAHARGQRLRFWATPDNPGPATEALWLELLRAGVDYINTDHLDNLQRFLLRNDPTPDVPPLK